MIKQFLLILILLIPQVYGQECLLDKKQKKTKKCKDESLSMVKKFGGMFENLGWKLNDYIPTCPKNKIKLDYRCEMAKKRRKEVVADCKSYKGNKFAKQTCVMFVKGLEEKYDFKTHLKRYQLDDFQTQKFNLLLEVINFLQVMKYTAVKDLDRCKKDNEDMTCAKLKISIQRQSKVCKKHKKIKEIREICNHIKKTFKDPNHYDSIAGILMPNVEKFIAEYIDSQKEIVKKNNKTWFKLCERGDSYFCYKSLIAMEKIEAKCKSFKFNYPTSDRINISCRSANRFYKRLTKEIF